MTYLALYLAAGLLNAIVAWDQKIILTWIEAVLYVFLWPLQLGFYLLMALHTGLEWVLSRIWGAT